MLNGNSWGQNGGNDDQPPPNPLLTGEMDDNWGAYVGLAFLVSPLSALSFYLFASLLPTCFGMNALLGSFIGLVLLPFALAPILLLWRAVIAYQQQKRVDRWNEYWDARARREQ